MNAHAERVAAEVAALLMGRGIVPTDDAMYLQWLPEADQLVIGQKLVEIWDREISLISTADIRKNGMAAIWLAVVSEADMSLDELIDRAHRALFRDQARSAQERAA